MKLKALFSLLLILVGCDEKSTESETFVKIFQLGKCISYNFAKVSSDSLCFNYRFENSLRIDFCVKGNCCPDSNRFVFDYKIKENQIDIFVDDIAPNLCKCICTYTIHADILGLSNSKYFVKCYTKSDGEYKVLHEREVYKFK